MQQLQRRVLPTLLAIGLTMAALSAPPSVLANTNPAPQPAPAPVTPAPPAVPAAPANPVRIGLGRSQTAAEVTAPGGLLVADSAGIHWQAPAGTVVKLMLDQGKVKVEGLALAVDKLRLIPAGPAPVVAAPGAVAPPPANPVVYKGKSYRGEIEVLVNQKDGKLSVVNVVNLEEYLYSVVSREMSYNWLPEAFKAQAVAARTYALSHTGKGSKWQGEGFDMVANTMDQDYAGLAAELPGQSQAVAATKGQVLTYNGQYATTFYHASSGGHTENNEVIYGYSPIPYLRGVPDYDNVPGNTRYSWQYAYTVDEFSKVLRESGYDVGTVTAIKPAGITGVSGRASQWQVTGTKSTATINHGPFRTLLDIPSSPRSVTLRQSGLANGTRTYNATESIAVMGPGGKVTTRTVRGAAVVSAAGTPVTAAGPVTTVGGLAMQQGGVSVSGGGYGHAVGMSQFGAYGMALQKKTYVEILTHFYKGTKVETR